MAAPNYRKTIRNEVRFDHLQALNLVPRTVEKLARAFSKQNGCEFQCRQDYLQVRSAFNYLMVWLNIFISSLWISKFSSCVRIHFESGLSTTIMISRIGTFIRHNPFYYYCCCYFCCRCYYYFSVMGQIFIPLFTLSCIFGSTETV